MPGARTDPSDALRTALRGLLAGFSIEVTPPELAAGPDLGDVLAAGTKVYITYLPRVAFAQVLRGARQVRGCGLRPVVHIAARAVPDLAALDRMLGELVDAGVEDILLVAGSLPRPAGTIENTLQVLESAPLRRRRFASIGVAGHPEGNPGVEPAVVDAALERKNALATAHGLPLHLVTQFCFAAAPVVAWERRIRAAGNALPVHVGLPGLTSPARLLKFGLACGVGASLAVLRKQAGGVFKLATTPVYHPDETLLGLAAERLGEPDSLLAGVHLFPFGAVAATAQWAAAVRDGRFTLAPDGHRMTVAG